MTVVALLITNPAPVRAAIAARLDLCGCRISELSKADPKGSLQAWIAEAAELAKVRDSIDVDVALAQKAEEAERRAALQAVDLPSSILQGAISQGITVGDLRRMPEEEIRWWPGVGPKAIEHMRLALDAEEV